MRADRPARGGIRILGGPILLLLLVLGLSRTAAEASPIKHHAIATRTTRGVQVWDEFVARGPSDWARVHPPTMSAQTSQTMHEVWKHELKSADPASYPNIQYLLWRRALDPARFDHWHPGLGQALASVLPLPTTTSGSTSPPQQLVSKTSSSASLPNVLPSSILPETVTSPSGGHPSPASIPEPETLTLAAVLFAAELFRRLWNRR
jgi:hypothetical protein